MNKILLLLMILLSFQVYAGTASMDAQEKKPVNIEGGERCNFKFNDASGKVHDGYIDGMKNPE